MFARIPKVKTPQPRKLCYILCYREPNYVRSMSLMAALRRMRGAVVLEAVNTSAGWIRYVETIVRLIRCRLTEKPDTYVLGFRGYEIFWVARLLTAGRALVFDHMMSPYDSLLNERKAIRRGGILDALVYRYERGILRSSDLVLTDTVTHQRFISKRFGIPSGKIAVVPVGTDESLFYPRHGPEAQGKERLHVLFYGSFQPLHGVPVILEVARRLRNKPVHFTIAGGKGPGKGDLGTHDESPANVTRLGWVPYRELPAMIARADLCLGGPFGDTGQAQRVITGKTFQFLAMGKPVVVGRIDEDAGFEDRHNCLLVTQGSVEALEEAVLWCLANRDRLEEIGRNGRLLYERCFSTACIAAKLEPHLQP
ncbi:MAG: putative glycosyl transferase [Syntrophaceae bacterium PtaU1.Bin231]|nr:MAG: putative glycosyl transferase [Syntrophaceae bacterium PtaB.Bin038]OPY86447.1 MAG: putative glycosyl transferase [Syntrophaceae bacterium PtaU1.Bin231]